MTQTQALALAFPAARVERLSFVLSPGEKADVERRARTRLGSSVVAAYVGWRGDTLAGTAFFDGRIVRTMPGVFMVVVAPDSSVARVDVLAFHEPTDYLPPARWLGRLASRRLEPQRQREGGVEGGITRLAGATLSARAVTESTRLALALYERIAAPAIARGRSGAGPR
jgi:hypothetical protein